MSWNIITDKTGLKCYIAGLQIIFKPVFMGMEHYCTTTPLTGKHSCDLSSSHTHKLHSSSSKNGSWNVDTILSIQWSTILIASNYLVFNFVDKTARWLGDFRLLPQCI